DAYFKEHGTRWFEFTQLPYFDVIQMTIIDPMHNLLMGVVKNHWHATWIQGHALQPGTAVRKRELNRVHDFLKDVSVLVGELAGGALSADTYKGLGTVCLPCVIPFIWEEYCVHAQTEFEKATASFEDHSKTWERLQWQPRKPRNPPVSISFYLGMNALLTSVLATKSRRKKKEILDLPKAPSIRMQAGEDVLFLKLATTVKIYVQQIITEAEIAQLKPNYHYSVHLPDQIRDYGPVYGFWCFLDECLNKLLKSFKSNNWGGGHLEVSMMHGWGRDIQIQDMVSAYPFQKYIIYVLYCIRSGTFSFPHMMEKVSLQNIWSR
ncbi:hypothetical protein K439DRAFT_1367646, partial [Ramaria rubella]